MREQTIGDFLAQLAARQPAPGGGAVAALHVAQAAALVGMVARYSSGRRYAQHAGEIDAIRAAADAARDQAVQQAGEDARAFDAVASAYAMPTTSTTEKAERTQAIQAALLGAAGPPAAVVSLADRVLGLAERLHPRGNPNVATDIGAAADAVRAAATTARLNVEVNATGIHDESVRARVRAAVAGVDRLIDRADRLAATVRAGIGA